MQQYIIEKYSFETKTYREQNEEFFIYSLQTKYKGKKTQKSMIKIAHENYIHSALYTVLRMYCNSSRMVDLSVHTVW